MALGISTLLSSILTKVSANKEGVESVFCSDHAWIQGAFVGQFLSFSKGGSVFGFLVSSFR